MAVEVSPAAPAAPAAAENPPVRVRLIAREGRVTAAMVGKAAMADLVA